MPAVRRIKSDYIDITLKDYSPEVKKEIKKAMRKGLSNVAKKYKNIVKADIKSNRYRSGMLYKSIGYQVTATGDGYPWLKIGSKNGGVGGGANHAHLVHDGTGARWNKKQNHSTGAMPAYGYLSNLKDRSDEAAIAVEAQLKNINIGG